MINVGNQRGNNVQSLPGKIYAKLSNGPTALHHQWHHYVTSHRPINLLLYVKPVCESGFWWRLFVTLSLFSPFHLIYEVWHNIICDIIVTSEANTYYVIPVYELGSDKDFFMTLYPFHFINEVQHNIIRDIICLSKHYYTSICKVCLRTWISYKYLHSSPNLSCVCVYITSSVTSSDHHRPIKTLTAHNWKKWRVFLTCPCHEIYRDEAVGLKSCKYIWKNRIYVNMWNLGQFRENLIFCQWLHNSSLNLKYSFEHVWHI